MCSRTSLNTSSFEKVLCVVTHELIGCHKVVRWSRCWIGEIGGYAPDLALSHQRFGSLRLDALPNILAYITKWGLAKVLPLKPHILTCKAKARPGLWLNQLHTGVRCFRCYLRKWGTVSILMNPSTTCEWVWNRRTS